MANMKMTVLNELKAAKKEFEAMLKGKSADGAQIDIHIGAAASALDAARARLEEQRDTDREKAGEAGHQLRVKLVLDHIKEYGGIKAMEAADVVELLSPIAFDPTVEIVVRQMSGWDGRTVDKLGVVKKLFEEVRTRNNAIAVLGVQAERLRGLPGVLETDKSLDADAIRQTFDDILNALNGWNDDLSVYGG